MTSLRVQAGGRVVMVSRPEHGPCGPLSIELAATFSRALKEHAAACVIGCPRTCEALCALVPRGVPLVAVRGITGAWLRALAWGASARRRAARRLAAASAAVHMERHNELRHHAGNERLPIDLRTSLRNRAKRSLARAASRDTAGDAFPRRLLRDRVPTELPPALAAEASRAAHAAGVPLDRPLAAIEIARRPDLFHDAIAWLVAGGYHVVRIGAAADPLARPEVVELSGTTRNSLLEILVLLTSRFVVAESAGTQHAAYLTNTPCLLLNAVDPFSAYPVRHDGLFTMRTAIDLDTGRLLGAGDLLDERYLRRAKTFGFRDNTPQQILEAVREMHAGVTAGWSESSGQAQWRHRATAAAALMSHVPLVAAWGPDRGFLGEGRLARWQADAAALHAEHR